MLQCGLLGKKLGHSYSPFIHKHLGEYSYDLFEKKEEEVEDFLKNGNWNGLNVTIPYKKVAFRYMDSISEAAQKTGCVNTVVKRADGTLYGDNTDVYGFAELVRYSGIPVKGKKTLILGSGGASTAVRVAMESLGAEPIVIISRSGEDNYDNLDRHQDAEIIVNTTPLGMYPETGKAAVDLTVFPKCSGVFDAIYNPARPAILLQAEELGIPCANGLYMLVAQAKRSSEQFMSTELPNEKIEEIYVKLERSMKNIVLVGMPGCGKTTISSRLGKETGREVLDSDEEIKKRIGISPADYIVKYGEAAFRDVESEVIADLGKLSGKIISTGGGAVLREENYPSLHQNGVIFWLQRNPDLLPSDNRPLSKGRNLHELFEERKGRYERFADVTIDNNAEVEKTVEAIIDLL